MLEIGINTNNESGDNIEEILLNIKKTGFNKVMLSYKSGDIEKIVKICKKLNIQIAYYHINNKYANNLWATGKSVDDYISDVIKQINYCGKFQIPIAVFHATQGSPSTFPLKPNKKGLENFKKILNVAKENNVKIAIENIDIFSIKNLYYLLDNIRDENLGFCYDAGHHHLYNPRKDLIKKYGNRLFALHLHDNLEDWYSGYDYTRDLHLLPLDGKIDFSKVCEKLKKANYNGIIMLEVHKKSCGDPQYYEKMTNEQFLFEAKKRADKLVEMIKC